MSQPLSAHSASISFRARAIVSALRLKALAVIMAYQVGLRVRHVCYAVKIQRGHSHSPFLPLHLNHSIIPRHDSFSFAFVRVRVRFAFITATLKVTPYRVVVDFRIHIAACLARLQDVGHFSLSFS